MTCITKGNKRCTKCCEAIHIPKKQWEQAVRGIIGVGESKSILNLWTPISKRRAKKINPWIFEQSWPNEEDRLAQKKFIANAQFFTCKALNKKYGCTIRDEEHHPEVCKTYKGGYEYSYTCNEDINIIARSG